MVGRMAAAAGPALQPRSMWKAGGRPTKWQTRTQRGKGKHRRVSPISNVIVWLHQIACIFEVHGHGVIGANQSPQMKLEKVFLVGLTWVGISHGYLNSSAPKPVLCSLFQFPQLLKVLATFPPPSRGPSEGQQRCHRNILFDHPGLPGCWQNRKMFSF